MVELIFALIIMGIVLISAPMLIRTAIKSGYVAIQQEGINEAAARISIIMGYHWDESDADESYIDPVLTVSAGDSNLSDYNSTGRRFGTPKESYRKFIREDGTKNILATAPAALGLEGGESKNNENDIDDFNGNSITLHEVASSTSDNTDSIQIDTTVSYLSDALTTTSGDTYIKPVGQNIRYDANFSAAAPGGSSNIKQITITLTSTTGVSELNKTNVLHAFSCNIGGYKLEEKDY
jgi:hypothetical protein